MIVIRYAEIALKGANRAMFEKQLLSNVARVVDMLDATVRRDQGQLLVALLDEAAIPEVVIQQLSLTPGIAWFGVARPVPSELTAITTAVEALVTDTIKPNDYFAIRAQRRDKSLTFTSKDIENAVGKVVASATGARVDLDRPDKTVFILAQEQMSLVIGKRFEGVGGLPVGTSQRVLSLLSGGFDSIVSSFLMARRGAPVDFLHIHPFSNETAFLERKILKIANHLHPLVNAKKLWHAPYLPFQMKLVTGEASSMGRYEMVLFRRMLLRVAQNLCEQEGYAAVILGDSLGQVASQTMPNMVAADAAVAGQMVLRPLIGFDKNEIIDWTRRLSLEKLAIEEYKDCCSLLSERPKTRVDTERLEAMEHQADLLTATDAVQAALSSTKLYHGN